MQTSEEYQSDFTFDNYCLLLDIAKNSYRFISHKEALSANDRFIIWRHDVDLSLNRAVRLAEVEASKGVSSTYFLNPHSEFYNLHEFDQFRKVNELIQFGHGIGLHFDAKFYRVDSEAALDQLIAKEVKWLKEWFGVDISAFSFHNPTEFLLTCEQDYYGGVINCYSRRFKETIPYCSDSNGYWRYRRLHDVLVSATDHCLQVLTHAGLWQERAMPARSRVFRCVYGRANNVLLSYDKTLADSNRRNYSGLSEKFRFLYDSDPEHYQFFDYLSNGRRLQSLFIELYCLHERQINRLCKAMFRKEWRVPAREVNAFFENSPLAIDGWRLFQAVFRQSWAEASGFSEDTHKKWVAVSNQLVHGRACVSPERLEEGCIYLCNIVEGVAKWGRAQKFISYDGITHLRTIGISIDKTADRDPRERLEEVKDGISSFQKKAWDEFLKRVTLAIVE